MIQDPNYCDFKQNITSIDIGTDNLALVKYNIIDKKFTHCNLIDIRDLQYNCDKESCDLGHLNCFTDYSEHVFINFSKYFDDTIDLILIERQPPGFGQIFEQLIFSKFRKKSILQSPRSMHCHFDIGHYDYEMRKEKVIKIAWSYVEDLNNFINATRKHDIADAVCFLLYYIHIQTQKEIQKEIDHKIYKDNQEYLDNGGRHFIKKISAYAYKA